MFHGIKSRKNASIAEQAERTYVFLAELVAQPLVTNSSAGAVDSVLSRAGVAIDRAVGSEAVLLTSSLCSLPRLLLNGLPGTPMLTLGQRGEDVRAQCVLAPAQGPLFGGVMLVGDGDEAREAESGEGGGGGRV